MINAECEAVGLSSEEDCPEAQAEAKRAWGAIEKAKTAIAEATGETPSGGDRTLTIKVRGGVVQEVSNIPHGWDYEIIDHDDLEAETAA